MATGFRVGTAASAKGWGEDGYGRVCVAVLGILEVQLSQAGRQRLFMLCEQQILRDLTAKSWHNDCFVCCCCCCCLAGARLGSPLPFLKM